MQKSMNQLEPKKTAFPVPDNSNLVFQNRFKVSFGKICVLTDYLVSFKYDTRYREYTLEFNIPESNVDRFIEEINNISRFTLEVFDSGGSMIYTRNFISNRITFCSTEFNYRYDNPAIVRLKGNF